MSEQSWLSTKEAALLLGVSQRTVQNWVDSGRIKSSRTMGGHRRLCRDDLNIHIAAIQPLAANPLEKIEASDNKDAPLLRVLFVEDDYSILRLCELKFRQFSVQNNLYLATNAYQGLMMVGKYQPHLIFTDLKMPGIDGLQMISEVIKMPDMKDSKMVIVTGLETKEIMKMGTMPDGVMVLPKPIPFNTVETILYQYANKMKTG